MSPSSREVEGMPKKQTTSKVQSSNSTCRNVGHDWMTTAAANWRVCKREKCRASERLVDDTWVSNARAYRLHDPARELGKRQRAPEQAAMWESGYEMGRNSR